MEPAAQLDSSLAVVLNKNARSVTRPIQRTIADLVPRTDVYISESPEHGTEIAHRIVDKGYRTVATGGGDGTFVQCVSDIFRYIESNRPDAEAPRFFVLRLGTGNAVATSFGASSPTRRGLARDLERARQPFFNRPLPVLEIEGKLTPMAGVGLDAHVQNDYYNHKHMLKDTALKALASGPAGYALSVSLRTVPRYLLLTRPEITVRNVGGPAYRVKHQGRYLEQISPGEILYRGPATVASASTIPYTGLNMKLFPYARLRDDRFSFRISSASVPHTLVNLPNIWKGDYDAESLWDFLADRVVVESEDPMPLQIGGDLAGIRRRVEISLANSCVTMAA